MQFKAALAALMILSTAACVATPTYTEAQQARLGQVTDTVQITDIKEAAGDDGLLSIAVFVTSLVRYNQNITYRVNWFDANGMPIQTTVSAPVSRLIDGEKSLNFKAVAPGVKAVRYTIDIKAEGE